MRDELKRVLYYNKLTFKESTISTDQLVNLLTMLQDKKITTKAGQRIIEQLPHNSKMPSEIAAEMGLVGVVEDDTVLSAVKQAIEENPSAVSDFFEGKSKALNFLVGQVMRITRGKADPALTNQMVVEELKNQKI